MVKTDLVIMGTEPYRNMKEQARERRREQRIAERKAKENEVFVRSILIFIVTVILFLGFTGIVAKADSTYARAKANGNGYEYVTEVSTEITSVDMENKIVYVSYKGNEYGYYANGKINVTGKVTVVLNENMEIVDVR